MSDGKKVSNLAADELTAVYNKVYNCSRSVNLPQDQIKDCYEDALILEKNIPQDYPYQKTLGKAINSSKIRMENEFKLKQYLTSDKANNKKADEMVIALELLKNKEQSDWQTFTSSKTIPLTPQKSVNNFFNIGVIWAVLLVVLVIKFLKMGAWQKGKEIIGAKKLGFHELADVLEKQVQWERVVNFTPKGQAPLEAIEFSQEELKVLELFQSARSHLLEAVSFFDKDGKEEQFFAEIDKFQAIMGYDIYPTKEERDLIDSNKKILNNNQEDPS